HHHAVAVPGEPGVRDRRVGGRVQGDAEEIARCRAARDLDVLAAPDIDAVEPVLGHEVADMDVRHRPGAVDEDAGRVRGVDTLDAVALPVEHDVVAPDLDTDDRLGTDDILRQFVGPGLLDHHGTRYRDRRSDPD